MPTQSSAAMAQKAPAAMASAQGKQFPLMSRGDIEALIAEGRKILIFDQHVLKVDGWIKYHPGGDKAILHMVGKDATDEITAYDTFDCHDMTHDILNHEN